MNNAIKSCYECTHFTAIGEGDHLCIAKAEPKMVIEDYIPTDEFFWCKGKCFEE